MKQLIRNIKFGFENQYFHRIIGYNQQNEKFKFVDYGFTTRIECLGKHKILRGKYSTFAIPFDDDIAKWETSFDNVDDALERLLEIVDGNFKDFSVVYSELEFGTTSITLEKLSTLSLNQIRQLGMEVA